MAWKILIVDDDQTFLDFLKGGLELHGHEVSTSASGSEAIKQIMGHRYDLLVSDYKMPGMDGKALYQLVKSVNPALADRVIFITGAPFERKMIRFFSSTNCTFLTKPLKLESLIEAIEKVAKNPS